MTKQQLIDYLETRIARSFPTDPNFFMNMTADDSREFFDVLLEIVKRLPDDKPDVEQGT